MLSDGLYPALASWGIHRRYSRLFPDRSGQRHRYSFHHISSFDKNGKTAATTVMPLISAALYLAQFLCPFLMSAVTSVFGAETAHLPYRTAAVLSVVFFCGPRSSASRPGVRKRIPAGQSFKALKTIPPQNHLLLCGGRIKLRFDSFRIKNAVLFTEFFSLRYRKVRRYLSSYFSDHSSMMQPSSSDSARTTRLRSVSLSRPPE